MGAEKLREAILKVALGFSLEEVTEEYDAKDGELRLIKRKETRKDVPPDLKAAKLLLDDGEDYSALSDEELEQEKNRLLAQLNGGEYGSETAS